MGIMTEVIPVELPEGGMLRFEVRWMSWPNFQSTRGLVSPSTSPALPLASFTFTLVDRVGILTDEIKDNVE
jgi:hypothetical protein